MNREQMIAWLTLEGYESHKCVKYGDEFSDDADALMGPGVWRYPDVYAYVWNHSVAVNDACKSSDMQRAMAVAAPLDTLQDEHLKLLYEAVANRNWGES